MRLADIPPFLPLPTPPPLPGLFGKGSCIRIPSSGPSRPFLVPKRSTKGVGGGGGGGGVRILCTPVAMVVVVPAGNVGGGLVGGGVTGSATSTGGPKTQVRYLMS